MKAIKNLDLSFEASFRFFCDAKVRKHQKNPVVAVFVNLLHRRTFRLALRCFSTAIEAGVLPQMRAISVLP